MPSDPVTAYLRDDEENQDESGLLKRVRAAGSAIVNDPGVQAGLAQIVAALAALAVRAVGPKCIAMTRRRSNDE